MANFVIGVTYSRLHFHQAIIINFSEDRDVSILYLSTKFQLDRFANKDLLSNRKKWKHTHADTASDKMEMRMSLFH